VTTKNRLIRRVKRARNPLATRKPPAPLTQKRTRRMGPKRLIPRKPTRKRETRKTPKLRTKRPRKLMAKRAIRPPPQPKPVARSENSSTADLRWTNY